MKLATTTIIFFCLYPTYAFLNIEALRQSKMKRSITGSSRVMLNQQKGNVDKAQISFDSLARYKNEKHNILALLDYRYGESFSVIDTRRGHLHLRYSYDVTSNYAVEIFQQSQFNKFQDLNARFLFGLGSRNKLYQGELLSLYSGAGAFYEKENLDDQPNTQNPRGNLYLNLLWTKPKHYSISSTVYYQPNLEDFHDNRIQLKLGLQTQFEGNFTQSIHYSLSRDTRTPTAIAATDSVLRAGLGYKY
jgi:putative salt-induced outer membrane protein YdiY